MRAWTCRQPRQDRQEGRGHTKNLPTVSVSCWYMSLECCFSRLPRTLIHPRIPQHWGWLSPYSSVMLFSKNRYWDEILFEVVNSICSYIDTRVIWSWTFRYPHAYIYWMPLVTTQSIVLRARIRWKKNGNIIRDQSPALIGRKELEKICLLDT